VRPVAAAEKLIEAAASPRLKECAVLITRSKTRITAAVLVVALIGVACSRASVSPAASGGPSASSVPSAPAAASSDVPATPSPSPSAAASRSPRASYGAYDWSYEGPTGPEHWAELDPSYYACKYGVTQSPIELAGADEGRTRDAVFDYHAGTALVVNEWNTIMAIPDRLGINTLQVYGISSSLRQLQFHVPPEHVIYGAKPAAAEVQFVHQYGHNAYTIVGALVVEGTEENEAWAPYIDAMDVPVGVEGVPVMIDWPNLIRIEPEMVSYRYDGSLTTPPCTERVDWIFFLEPIELSAAQISKMRAAYDGNARPLQTVGYYRSITRDDKDD
jgi:carbonic anhydrase